jgi:hypothetical protein
MAFLVFAGLSESDIALLLLEEDLQNAQLTFFK